MRAEMVLQFNPKMLSPNCTSILISGLQFAPLDLCPFYANQRHFHWLFPTASGKTVFIITKRNKQKQNLIKAKLFLQLLLLLLLLLLIANEMNII